MRTLAPVVALALAACQMGVRGDRLEPAVTGRGEEVTVHTDRRYYRGELLAVRDDGVLILDSGENIVLVKTARIRLIQARTFSERIGGSMSRAAANRLRLYSRFPGGVSPELEKRLLEAYGKTETVTIDE